MTNGSQKAPLPLAQTGPAVQKDLSACGAASEDLRGACACEIVGAVDQTAKPPATISANVNAMPDRRRSRDGKGRFIMTILSFKGCLDPQLQIAGRGSIESSASCAFNNASL